MTNVATRLVDWRRRRRAEAEVDDRKAAVLYQRTTRWSKEPTRRL